MKNLFFVLIALTLFSCAKEEETTGCEYGDPPFVGELTTLDESFNCENTLFQMSVKDLPENEFLLIRTQEDFDNRIEGNCTPTIDFCAYDLIVGHQRLSNGLQSIAYEYFNDNTRQELRVNVQLDLTTIAPLITYHSLIPKIIFVEPNLSVDVNVQQ